ncbi:hypothetical protein Tco_1247687 [Tanacetum coccineum]
MILESIENGPLIWPTIEENGVTRTKKYVELFAAEKIQADCYMKATNIILQGLLADIYSLVNHHQVAKDLWERVQLLMQGEALHKYYLRFTQLINDMNIYNMKIKQFQVIPKFLNSLLLEWSKFVTNVKLVKDLHTTNFDQLHAYLKQHELHANEVRFAVPVFSPGDDPIACLNKVMVFLTAVASSRFPSTNNQLRTSSMAESQCNKYRRDKVKVILVLGKGHMARQCTQPKQPRNATWYKEKAMLIEDLDTYDSDYDDISNAQEVLMANISNYGSDVILKVSHFETYLNDMENQSVLAIQDFEQSPVVDVTDNEIHSDSNIILYSQYLQETQQANVQDTNLQA